MGQYKTSNKYYRLWLFWVGIIATVAYRAIILFNNLDSRAVKIAWYVGTIGFVWYFAHRYRVENFRDRLVKEKSLVSKIKNRQQLSADEQAALVYVLKTLHSTKARWNYIAIFAFSIIALIYGIMTDFAINR
jgi:hypothetical protein